MKKKMLFIPLFIIIFVSITMLTYTSLKLIFSYQDTKEIEKIITEIEEKIDIEEIEVPEEEIDSIISVPKEELKNDYYDYISMPILKIDFENLLKINKETVAFLKVNGTNVNYPVVQTSDNKYYLNHAFDGSRNGEGWVFLDYRNNLDILQDNTIIYAHGGDTNTMFGSLKNIFQSEWNKNPENHIIFLSTPKKDMTWQIFSAYIIPTETYYLTSTFGSVESHEKFIETIKERSQFNFNTTVSKENKILTLSTCYDDTSKIVLHAKLIKSKNRGGSD